MEIVRLRALRGPNLWGRHTMIEALINCTEDECQITNLAGFETRLRSRFPQMGPLVAGGHNEPLTLAHALEVVALGLQAAISASPISSTYRWGRSRPGSVTV